MLLYPFDYIASTAGYTDEADYLGYDDEDNEDSK